MKKLNAMTSVRIEESALAKAKELEIKIQVVCRDAIDKAIERAEKRAEKKKK